MESRFEYEEYIGFKISRRLKEEFARKTYENGENMSSAIRRLIVKYVRGECV